VLGLARCAFATSHPFDFVARLSLFFFFDFGNNWQVGSAALDGIHFDVSRALSALCLVLKDCVAVRSFVAVFSLLNTLGDF